MTTGLRMAKRLRTARYFTGIIKLDANLLSIGARRLDKLRLKNNSLIREKRLDKETS